LSFAIDLSTLFILSAVERLEGTLLNTKQQSVFDKHMFGFLYGTVKRMVLLIPVFNLNGFGTISSGNNVAFQTSF
jgi:hypothetical protein